MSRLRINADLSTAKRAPDSIASLKLTKQQGLKLSKYLTEPYSDRISDCANIVKFRQFKSGFTRIEYINLCRVRGCPNCEEAKRRERAAKFAARLKRTYKQFRTGGTARIATVSKPVSLENLRNQIALHHKALGRMLKLKDARFLNWYRIGEVKGLEDGMFQLCSHLFLQQKPSDFSGRNYIKQSQWAELWERSARGIAESVEVERFSYKTSPYAPIDYFRKLGKIDLLQYPPDIIPNLHKQLLRVRFFATSSNGPRQVEQVEPVYPRIEKVYPPSRTAYCIYGPDVDDPDFGNSYLELEDFSYENNTAKTTTDN